jgi:plasmid stabilization system protein ParE
VNSKPVVALATVRDDVQLAFDYFQTRVGASGDKFLDRYFTTVDQIALNPWSFPLRYEDYHRALVPRSSFAVYYFQEEKRSVIAAVVDARRNPDWIRRILSQRRKS